VKCGRSPRYCNRERIPDDATALIEGWKAREENDPRARRPPPRFSETNLRVGRGGFTCPSPVFSTAVFSAYFR
jgi:hypothetical protein